MTWTKIIAGGRGTDPNGIKLGINMAPNGYSLSITIGNEAAAGLNISAGRRISIEWGSDDDHGKLRICNVNDRKEGFKVSKSGENAVAAKTNRLPPVIREEKVMARPCAWTAHDGAAIVSIDPKLLRPNGRTGTPSKPAKALPAPKTDADKALAAAGGSFEDANVVSRRQ